MKAFLETTEWATEYRQPNHVYFLSDSKDKLYAYIKSGTDEVFEFKKPYKFSASRRKFKEVKNVWGYVKPDDAPVGCNWKVAGSRGDEYIVNEHMGSWSCTCAGFKFGKGDCKHIRELQK